MKLEKYAENLENLVNARTAELEEEKRKTDILLYRMLPRFVEKMQLRCVAFVSGIAILNNFINLMMSVCKVATVGFYHFWS
jgi:hypothetical protein